MSYHSLAPAPPVPNLNSITYEGSAVRVEWIEQQVRTYAMAKYVYITSGNKLYTREEGH